MPKWEVELGASWMSCPVTWRNFVNSMPTFHAMHSGYKTSAEQRARERAHNAALKHTLADQYNARYVKSRKHKTFKVVFKSESDLTAWMLTYAAPP